MEDCLGTLAGEHSCETFPQAEVGGYQGLPDQSRAKYSSQPRHVGQEGRDAVATALEDAVATETNESLRAAGNCLCLSWMARTASHVHDANESIVLGPCGKAGSLVIVRKQTKLDGQSNRASRTTKVGSRSLDP